MDFSGGLGGKESACQCRRLKRFRFNPCVRKIPWRKKWQPTPVFLPKKFHGLRSLAGYSPWGHKEADTTEHQHTHISICSCRRSPISLETFAEIFSGKHRAAKSWT